MYYVEDNFIGDYKRMLKILLVKEPTRNQVVKVSTMALVLRGTDEDI